MKKFVFFIVAVLLISGGCSNENAVNNIETTTGSDMYSIVDFSEYVDDITLPEETSDTVTSDMDIITAEGHPKFWDSIELSHKIWDNEEKGKVRFADSFERYKDSNIISMESYGEEVIEDIEIYFCNASDPIALTVEEVLPIVESYLPMDILNTYYTKTDSFIAIPEEGTEKDTHYFMTYFITDTTKKEELNLFYRIAIEIQVENKIVTMFRIYNNTLPKWTNFLDTNGYYKEDWNFSF